MENKGKGKGKGRPRTDHEGPEGGSRCIALLFLQPRGWMGEGGHRHATAAYPRERDPVPIV